LRLETGRGRVAALAPVPNALHLTYRTPADLFDPPHGQSGLEGEKGEVVERQERVSRIANERTYNLLWGLDAVDGAFLCECDRPSCIERVPMTLAEYVRRRDREEIIYAGGHSVSTGAGSSG
jgi:hypothetical protein